jgi:hypothetical protein
MNLSVTAKYCEVPSSSCFQGLAVWSRDGLMASYA